MSDEHTVPRDQDRKPRPGPGPATRRHYRRGRAGDSRSRSPLRIRNFRLYLAGQLTSNVGTWMQRAAQDWLVLQLTHNAGTAIGVTTALQFLPQALFGLWGGVIADRYPRQRLLLITQTVMGIQALLLGALTLTGAVRTWHVYVLAFLLGTATAIDSPARNAFVADLVNRAQVPEAVGLNTAQFNAARILGPAAAGLMIAVLDTGPVFLLNAVSYLAVLAGLLRMRTHDPRPAPPRRRGFPPPAQRTRRW